MPRSLAGVANLDPEQLFGLFILRTNADGTSTGELRWVANRKMYDAPNETFAGSPDSIRRIFASRGNPKHIGDAILPGEQQPVELWGSPESVRWITALNGYTVPGATVTRLPVATPAATPAGSERVIAFAREAWMEDLANVLDDPSWLRDDPAFTVQWLDNFKALGLDLGFQFDAEIEKMGSATEVARLKALLHSL